MDLVACHMAAEALYEKERIPGSPTWDELPANNQASQIATVMRVAAAYTAARIDKGIDNAKRTRESRGLEAPATRNHGGRP